MCQAAVFAAGQGIAVNVTTRGLVSASVRSTDPLDPTICRDWGYCDPAVAAIVVELVYPGPRGEESWSVLVVQKTAGGPLVPAKPFPGAVAPPASP